MNKQEMAVHIASVKDEFNKAFGTEISDAELKEVLAAKLKRDTEKFFDRFFGYLEVSQVLTALQVMNDSSKKAKERDTGSLRGAA